MDRFEDQHVEDVAELGGVSVQTRGSQIGLLPDNEGAKRVGAGISED